MKKNDKRTFTPLPITYAELYAQLYRANLVRPNIVAPFQPPYPAWYDEKVNCDYHGGIPRHSIENCTVFKKFAHKVIKVRVLTFGGSDGNDIERKVNAGRGKAVDQSGNRSKTMTHL
ncbi:hypothetical protein GQ457_02G027940 [Hibiscus cannabinus]